MTKAIILCQTLIQFNTKITQFTLANMPKLCAKQSTWTNLYWDKQGLLVIFTIYVILDSDLKKLQIMQLIICLLSMMLQISRKLAYVKIRIWQKADYGCLLDSHMGTLPGVLPKMRYKYGIKKAIEGVYCNDVSWVGCGAVKGFHIHWISWSAAKLTTTRLLLCSSSSMPANRNLGKVTGQRSSVNCCLMFALVDSWISHTCNGRTDTAPVQNVFNIKLEQLERLRSDDTSWLPTVLSHVGSHVKTRSNDLEDIGQGQRSSHAIHHLMLVIVCTTYGKNPSETRCYRADTIFKVKAKWPWRYRSRSKVIICNTHSHTSDHLCYIWKESIENCRFFFQGRGGKFSKICPKFKFPDSEKKT